MKRAFDIAFALLALLLALPAIVVIAILVKCSSPGPIVFRQLRACRGGEPFVLYKFRSMRDGSGRLYDLVHKGDPRVTPIGRWIRKFYLDELPQLVNVLRGDMSIVGPRPLPMAMVVQHSESGWCRRMLTVRPGLTGPSQILGREWLKENGFEYVFLVEAYYARNCSWFLDLRILRNTFWMVVGGKGV